MLSIGRSSCTVNVATGRAESPGQPSSHGTSSPGFSTHSSLLTTSCQTRGFKRIFSGDAGSLARCGRPLDGHWRRRVKKPQCLSAPLLRARTGRLYAAPSTANPSTSLVDPRSVAARYSLVRVFRRRQRRRSRTSCRTLHRTVSGLVLFSVVSHLTKQSMITKSIENARKLNIRE